MDVHPTKNGINRFWPIPIWFLNWIHMIVKMVNGWIMRQPYKVVLWPPNNQTKTVWTCHNFGDRRHIQSNQFCGRFHFFSVNLPQRLKNYSGWWWEPSRKILVEGLSHILWKNFWNQQSIFQPWGSCIRMNNFHKPTHILRIASSPLRDLAVNRLARGFPWIPHKWMAWSCRKSISNS